VGRRTGLKAEAKRNFRPGRESNPGRAYRSPVTILTELYTLKV